MHTNSLISESSPYLLQHAHNPVNWLPWGAYAFKKARKENKLVLISIGYSACHWCHVMEHESFEDAKVAEFMNENFINIKVDREERPDVDMLYMSAVQLMKGQGGWPLNCFALPDGRPFYGGTYFPKDQWLTILNNLHQLFTNETEKVLQYATELTNGIKQNELMYVKNPEEFVINYSVIERCISNWKKRLDNTLGGSNRAPKFPLPNNYSFLLKYAYLYKDAEIMKHVDLTLRKMALGGIYDQLDGGFARYSVDLQWKVPHFEKMLYDNAQLITLYCEAYRCSKNSLYKQVVEQTIAFVSREWVSNEGGFYSALDADSEGEEGKYYVWKKDELEDYLGDDFGVFSEYFHIDDVGYWENGNYILVREEDVLGILLNYNLKEAELSSLIERCKAKLMDERNKRIKPGLDNKILTSWNGLICKALCEAYLTFGNAHYKNLALQNAEFICEKLMKTDGFLYHSFSNNKGKIDGFLDDYAFAIDALVSIYSVSQDEKWLNTAVRLCDYAISQFYNAESNLFYFTGGNCEKLAVRTSEVNDNVIPASNSQMAYNLFRLYKITGQETYSVLSIKMLQNFIEGITQYGEGYSNWASLYIDLLNGVSEVCIVGKDVDEKVRDMYNYYLPNAIFVVAASASGLDLLKHRFVDGKTMIYVCKNKTCQLPTEDLKEAIRQIETIL